MHLKVYIERKQILAIGSGSFNASVTETSVATSAATNNSEKKQKKKVDWNGQKIKINSSITEWSALTKAAHMSEREPKNDRMLCVPCKDAKNTE